MIVTATYHGGYAATVDARGHAIAVDEPEGSGGEDGGAMPTELLAGALASCFALALGHVARREGAELPGLRVDVRGRARRPRAALRPHGRDRARRRPAGALHGTRPAVVLGLEHVCRAT